MERAEGRLFEPNQHTLAAKFPAQRIESIKAEALRLR